MRQGGSGIRGPFRLLPRTGAKKNPTERTGDVRPAPVSRARNQVRDMRAGAERGRGRTCDTRETGTLPRKPAAARTERNAMEGRHAGQGRRRFGKVCGEGRGGPHDKT